MPSRFWRTRWRCVLLSGFVLTGGSMVGLARLDNNLVDQVFVRSFADPPSDTAPVGSPGDALGAGQLWPAAK